TTPTQTTTEPRPRTEWTVEVVEVTDGETMDVRYPNGSIETIRLLGVDTPETSVSQVSPAEWETIPDTVEGRDWLVKWGDRASRFAEDRLAGEEIHIETDPKADRRGYYGRLLVYAFQSESSEISFNERLLTNGYARYYDSTFTEQDTYQQLESSAQSASTGVWGYTAPTTTESSTDGTSPGELVVWDVHADADGNDHDNLNDEYIVFKNTGGSPLDMGGWRISDNAGHSYTVPSDFELGADETVTIYTGSGSDSGSELYWGSSSAVWNNGGDTIVVEDADGKTVVDYSYSG
ncbi:MAG: lamin tail domain-containing protein, partial [Halobacteriaceae archaeon]